MLLWSRSRPSAFCRIVEGARGCGPLIDLVLLWAGLAAAAGPRDEAGAGQRDAEEGEHEQQRGARQRDRQGLVDVAHDRAQGWMTSTVVGAGWARLAPGWSMGESP